MSPRPWSGRGPAAKPDVRGDPAVALHVPARGTVRPERTSTAACTAEVGDPMKHEDNNRPPISGARDVGDGNRHPREMRAREGTMVTRRSTHFTSRDMTEWAARDRVAPLSTFLRTESGSAGVLVVAIAVAVLWATVDIGGYERTWATHLAIRLGGSGVDLSLRKWVNSGLMTIF